MNKIIDLDWLSQQVGLPVSFLIGIPVFMVVILTLMSMTSSRQGQNYKSLGNDGGVNIGNWLIGILFLFLLGFLVLTYLPKS